MEHGLDPRSPRASSGRLLILTLSLSRTGEGTRVSFGAAVAQPPV